MRKVVITGFGAVSPIGCSKEDIIRNASQGNSGIGEITSFDVADIPVALCAEAKGFDPKEIFTSREIKNSSKCVLMARASAKKAFSDSGLVKENIDPDRLGVVFSSAIGGLDVLENNHKALLSDSPRRVSPYLIPSVLTDMPAAGIAIDLGAKAACLSISSACASGADAIGTAYRMIQHGECDIIASGGVEAAITPVALAGFSAMRVLYEENDLSVASIPFDKRRSGFVMGEGACCLILEEESRAVSRGAEIYGYICGYGLSCDAGSIVSPSADGAAKAMEKALADACILPDDICYINAHGTSTNANDIVEGQAIRRVFGENYPPVSSTKEITGHLLGAAGAFETGLTALAVKHRFIPPNVKWKEMDEDCGIIPVHCPTQANINYAMSTSLGFGGHNCAVIIKKH